ncbi:MAG: class A beta-lactamase-related serine hydrolase [Acidobacteria bacterium]|nr:class A beta-lactamase-related serine hydrolase [Acidobacteriota bacterium]
MRNCFTFCLLPIVLLAGDLETALEKRIAQGPAKVFLAAKNLKTGQSVSIRGAEAVRTASTIKLPVLVEIYAQAAEGKLKLDEELVMRPADVVSGSGVLRELSAGTKLKLKDIGNLMIVVSDNTATNMLIERIGADAVNARMDKLKLPRTRLMRKIRGDGKQLKAAEGWSIGIVGSLGPLEVRGLGRKLDGLTIANKTGSLDHLRSDVGIVYTKAGPIAIAITVEDIPGIDYGEDNIGLLMIADLAKLIVDGLSQSR